MATSDELGSTIRERLAPFRVPQFRLFYGAQAVSLIGSWMQELARSWIIMNLLQKASAMGLVMVAAAIPNMIFGGFGGVVADRSGAKRILIITQVLLAFTAIALGLLVSTGHVDYWHLMAIAAIEGVILSFDMPALNMVTPQLVPQKDFQQAMALNAVNFHLSRMIGPSLAGFVMGVAGPSAVFWINGVSFFGVVWAVSRLPLKDQGTLPKKESSSQAFREAIAYVRSHPLIMAILVQLILVMGIIFPLVFTTLRLHIQQTFSLSARDFGFVFAVPGLGALTGSLIFLFSSPKNPLKILPISITGIVAGLIAVAQSTSLLWATVFMAFFSISMFLTMSALLVTVQLRVDPTKRGRVSALTGMMFASLSPLMAVPIGFATDHFGTQPMILGAAGVFGILSLLMGVKGIRAHA